MGFLLIIKETGGKPMGSLKKLFCISFLFLLLSACSTTNLQTIRMDKSEQQIIIAEQALSQSDNEVAIDNIGSASAYLATVTDFINFLSNKEKIRLKNLKQKADKINRMIPRE